MDALSFLRGALAEGNFYCLLALKDGGKEKENRRQVFFSSRAKLVDAAAIWDSRGWDTFFALGSFADAGSRTAEEVQNVKAFFVDLDIGDDPKKYVNVSEAIAGLRKFCKQLGLPKPTIVNSGYGVHVYWMLKEYVTKHDWSCAATQFKKVMAENGLLADPAVTADCARVLRIPSTHNYKRDTPKEVTVVTQGDWVDFDLFVAKLGLDSIPVPTKVEQDAASAFLDALVRDRESSFRDILNKTADGRGCRQLEIIVTDQENTSEPMWRAGLSIAKFCADGKKAAQLISRRHPEYDEESTQEKFDRIKGPYLCSTFDSNYEGVCTDCPNWGKVKSPISLGAKFREAPAEEVVVEEVSLTLPNAPINTYTIPTYPKPYFRGANGGIYVRSSNADGDIEEESIYHNDLYVVGRLTDAEIGESVVLRLHLPQDGVREFNIPLTAVTSRDEFRKEMSKQGVAVMKMDKLMTYVTTWVNELQETSVATLAHRQFGWTDDNFDTFILGNQSITATTIDFNPPSKPTAGLFPDMEPRGSLQGWKDNMNFLDKEGLELQQYLVGMSFGSVLMPLVTSESCAHMHIFSKKGSYGKTTALKGAASVWGKPAGLVIHESDTHNTRMNRGEVYHNIPLLLDELTNATGKELSVLCYQLTGGKQRNRMKGSANEERVRGMPWAMLSAGTGNTAFVERISMYKNAPAAEARRVLDVEALKVDFGTTDEAIEYNLGLTKNYGWAGPIFVQYIMQNLAECRALVANIRSRIEKMCTLSPQDILWSLHAANSLAGLLIARNLGLVEYDVKRVQKWIVGQIKSNQSAMLNLDSGVEETLSLYILEHWGRFLKLKSTQDLRKVNSNGLDDLVIPDMMPVTEIVGRYETDTKRAYLIPKPLKDWCGKQQINYSAFVKDLCEKMGATKRKVHITKGTYVKLRTQDVIIVDCSVGEDDDSGDIADE